MKESWWLVSGAGQPAKLHPGKNRAQVSGRLITFNIHSGGFTKATAQAWVWFMDEPAADQPVPVEWPPVESEYLGKINRWHVYAHFTELAKRDWPTAREAIERALAANAQP